MDKKTVKIMTIFLVCVVFIAACIDYFTKNKEESAKAGTLAAYEEESVTHKLTLTPDSTPEINSIPSVD